MAKHRGPYRFRGTLHNVTGVQTREGFHLRKKKEISKEAYATAPQYKAFRENGQLMGTGSQWSKALRAAIAQYIVLTSDPRMYARLNAPLRAVAKDQEDGLQKLRGFEFHKTKPLSQVFRIPFHIDKANGTLDIEASNAKAGIKAPPGTTHIQITLLAVGCDFNSDTFALLGSESAYSPLNKTAAPLTLQIPDCNLNMPVTLFLIRISFHEERNGNSRELSAAMKIAETTTTPA